MKILRFPVLWIALAATQLGATDCGGVIQDPGFDLWCGDELCTWKVVRGDVRRVSTWHEGDAGVELVGDDAAISQVAPVNDGDGTCIRFELVADVAETVEAFLSVDVFGDGSVERMERIPTSHWKLISYKLPFTPPFDGVRFELSKRGSGRAVVARVEATIDHECDGLTPISGGPAPLGASCIADAGCASGMCRGVEEPWTLFGVAIRCVGCDSTLGAAACGGGQVCGLGEPLSPLHAVPIRCVPAAVAELGEQCLSDAECGTGHCTGRRCSTCAGAADCAAGELCNRTWEGGPFVCAPNRHLRKPSEPCVSNDDCATSRCGGPAQKVCEFDGRPCLYPGSCPITSGLSPGACTEVGIQGGTCQ